MGYFLVFWSLFSYGVLGACHKLAVRKHCRPQPLLGMLMFSACLGMNFFVLLGKGYAVPVKVFYLAFVCGAIALCAFWAFQEGLKHGKIATSWLIINLSAAIPTVGSILIYHEPVNLKKISILGLIVVAIVLVWLDRLEDLRRQEQVEAGSGATSPDVMMHIRRGKGNSVWLPLMLLAFLFDGCGVFGLRVLAGMGLAGVVTNQYLVYYYMGGFVFMALQLVAKKSWPNRTEIGVGGGMALCSISGTSSLAYALNTFNIPGNVAFPIANGGSLFIVVTAGVLSFHERLGWYGICGCVLGTMAIVLLSVS
jgi:drug/metabolite transporter (DMT)-like permease